MAKPAAQAVCDASVDQPLVQTTLAPLRGDHAARQMPEAVPIEPKRRRHFGMIGAAETQGAIGDQVFRCKNPEDRKSVGEGKSVSVRVDLGGSRTIKKKKKQIRSQMNITALE